MKNFFLAAGLQAFLRSPASAGTFDVPIDLRRVELARTPEAPERNRVTCASYRGFMVKEVDRGEKGAERLSLVPMRPDGVPLPCEEKLAPLEKVIEGWSGYFKGVRGHFAVFDAEDGVNGGVGFAVFRAPDAQRIFVDSALGPLHFSSGAGGRLRLSYQRVVPGTCSMVQKGKTCWDEFRRMTGLAARSPPDCARGYAEAKAMLAGQRCRARGEKVAQPSCVRDALAQMSSEDASPSVLSYAVEIPDLEAPRPRMQGTRIQCWPAD